VALRSLTVIDKGFKVGIDKRFKEGIDKRFKFGK
jgi:hypothetical protein